jgi:predicted ATPase
VELARFALAHDPCSEAALADLLEALRACGREAEAQEAYRQFAMRLMEEFGIEPQVRLQASSAPRPTDHGVIVTTTARAPAFLIGRRLEQAQLVRTLRQADCRRATILGPGGVGKSSLATSALTLLDEDFPDGVRWVGLRDVATATQIPGRIAEACGFKGGLSQDQVEELAARIGQQAVLLVLDNCEHLPDLSAIGDVLIERCPRLKILHASRARIGCAGEWLLPLSGLAVPDANESELDVLRTFDSVRLFEARAREVDPDFDPRRCIDEIAALVRMVEGLPLAIVMAAACTRLLPLREIVSDITRLLDMRGTQHGAAAASPSTERSLRVSFEHSWRLLSPSEQKILARLAVFNGSFSLAAGQCVAGAKLPSIAALADQSLVAACGAGRFSLHPLIREFAREQLVDEPSVRARHASYYADVMFARSHPATAASVPWDHDDVSHCLEAWRWATTAGDIAMMLRMATPLVRLFNGYLRWQEGIDTIESALATLQSRDARTEGLRSELYYGLALCRFYNGEMTAAEESARHSLRLCHALRVRDTLPAANLYIIGSSLGWQGECERANRFFEQSLAIAGARGESESIAKALYGIAFLEQAAGRWDRSREFYGRSEAISRERSMHQWQALSLNGIGACWLAQGRMAEALSCFDQGIRVCTEYEVNGRRSFLLANRGLALIRLGDLRGADASIERALREAKEWNIYTALVDSYLARGALAMARHDLESARCDLRSAMQVASKIQSRLRRMPVVRHFGNWLVASGQRERGAAVLEFVRDASFSMRRDSEAAGNALAELFGKSAPTKALKKRAREKSMEQLEAEILGIESDVRASVANNVDPTLSGSRAPRLRNRRK